MQEYVDKFSPYSQDKGLLSEHNINQDKDIGILKGQTERLFNLSGMNNEAHITYDNKLSDLYKKLDTITNYLEEEKRVKH